MRVAACSQYRSILLVRRHFGATVARAGFFGSRHSFEDPFDEEFERGHEKKHREKVEDLYRKDIERRQWQERKCKSLLNLDSGLQYKRAELKDAYLTRSKELHPDTSTGDDKTRQKKAKDFDEVKEAHTWLVDNVCFTDDEKVKPQNAYTGRLYPDRSLRDKEFIPIDDLFDFDALKTTPFQRKMNKYAMILGRPLKRHRNMQKKLMEESLTAYPLYLLKRVLAWGLSIWFFIEYIGYFIRWSLSQGVEPGGWMELRFRLPLGIRLNLLP